MRKPLSRRTFLRGLLGGTAITLGLPPLEAFFNANGTAYANGQSPRRFGLFFWGNGILPERWIPTDSGPDWTLSDQLKPIERVRDHITLLSGMEVKTGNPLAHVSGPAGLLTGQSPIVRGDEYTFAAPTMDQVMAATIGGETQFRSLEVGVEPRGKGMSFNGPDSVNPPTSDPAALFERLFGANFREPGSEPIIDPTLSVRRSILDAVMADANTLKNRLGANDQQRLDQHFAAVRDLELRVARLQEAPPDLAACVQPTMPAAFDESDGRVRVSERARVVTDLVTMAFACDLTRVLTFWHSDPLNDLLYPETTAGHHQLTHDEPGDQPQVHSIVLAIMESFATMVDTMRSIPEGDGTLLDNSIIMGTTDVSFGRTHQINEYPILLAGTGQGRLKTGFHYRSETKENTSLVSFSLLRAMGVQISEFGVDEGRVTQGLSVIES
ncbi:MAG: DUF1552 domain-containing protein [Myxococcota bacterium]